MNKPSEPKSSYKILSRQGVKKHYTLNKEYLKEIFRLKPEKIQIELEIPYFVEDENFTIVKNNSSEINNLSYTINDLKNNYIGDLNISENNCKINMTYKDRKINIEDNLNNTENTLFNDFYEIVEKQSKTKYYKLNKTTLKELYDLELDNFVLRMPINKDNSENFSLVKRNIYSDKFFLSTSYNEKISGKELTGVNYAVNYYGENIGHLTLYKDKFNFKINYLGNQILIENTEIGKLRFVTSELKFENNAKNIGDLIKKVEEYKKQNELTKEQKLNREDDNIKEEILKKQDDEIKKNNELLKKLKENEYEEVLKDNNTEQSIKINLNEKINDDYHGEKIYDNAKSPLKPIELNITSTDLDNLSLPSRKKISEISNLTNNANAPPPPTQPFYSDNRRCQRVLLNIEVSHDHWLKMQPQVQRDLYDATQSRGAGRYVFDDYLFGKLIRTDANNSRYNFFDFNTARVPNTNGCDTSFMFSAPFVPANAVGEDRKLLKTIYRRNRAYVATKLNSYLQTVIDVFDKEGIAVGVNMVYINVRDNLKYDTKKYNVVDNPRNPGMPAKPQIFSVSVTGDDRGYPYYTPQGTFLDQRFFFNQYTNTYQKQKRPKGALLSISEDPNYSVLSEIPGLEQMGITSSSFANFIAMLLVNSSYYSNAYKLIRTIYRALTGGDPFAKCTNFIVPSLEGQYCFGKIDKTRHYTVNLGSLGFLDIGQRWYNIVEHGMENALLDRFSAIYGGNLVDPLIFVDTVQRQGLPDTLIYRTIGQQEGLHFYIGKELPFYDNSAPNNKDITKPYAEEQYIRQYTSNAIDEDAWNQSYEALNDRTDYHPFLADDVPSFNSQNFLPAYSNMRNNFHDVTNNPTSLGRLSIGMHLKDIGVVMPHLSGPWTTFNENGNFLFAASDRTPYSDPLNGEWDSNCTPALPRIIPSIGILPLFFDKTYHTTNYKSYNGLIIPDPACYSCSVPPNIYNNNTTSYSDISGPTWNLMDHDELYGEWYEYGQTDYPPFNIDKWNTWMLVYGVAHSLGARYFTTEANPNTILSPLARNFNYNEGNYNVKDGTPRIAPVFPVIEYRNKPYNYADFYTDYLIDQGFFLFADLTNPGDYDMDGQVGGWYDYLTAGVILGFNIAEGVQAYQDAKNASLTSQVQPQSSRSFTDPNITGIKLPGQNIQGGNEAALQDWLSRDCMWDFAGKASANVLGACSFAATVVLSPQTYLIGLAARNIYAFIAIGLKFRFSIDNVCSPNDLGNNPGAYSKGMKWPLIYGMSETVCGYNGNICGTPTPYGVRNYDARYNYIDLQLENGITSRNIGKSTDPRTGSTSTLVYNKSGKPLSSVDLISWNKGFDKLTGDLIRLNMTNYYVSGQNPYSDSTFVSNGSNVTVRTDTLRDFRLRFTDNPRADFPFYGFQVPYAKINTQVLEYVSGDTIRASTDSFNVRMTFNREFSSKYTFENLLDNQNILNNSFFLSKRRYKDNNITFRWSYINNPFNQIYTDFSTSNTVKFVAPTYKWNLPFGQDSGLAIYPLRLYSTNAAGCISNPALKFIKVHPRIELPIRERFNMLQGNATLNGLSITTGFGSDYSGPVANYYNKYTVKGWDFVGPWSSGDGIAENLINPNIPFGGATNRGYYLRNSFVSDSRMSAGTGWTSSNDYHYSGTTQRNWKAIVYTPMEMERGDIMKERHYFDANQNVRNNYFNNTSQYQNIDNTASYVNFASPYKNWYSKIGAFKNLLRPVLNDGLKHFTNGQPTNLKSWDYQKYQVHGSYNYWRSGTVDTARTPVYINKWKHNNILSLKFDISSLFPSEAPVGVRQVAPDGTIRMNYYSVDSYLNTTRQIQSNGISPYNFLHEQITDTLYVYGRFGLYSPLTLLRKIGGKDLNTTFNGYQPKTYFYYEPNNPASNYIYSINNYGKNLTPTSGIAGAGMPLVYSVAPSYSLRLNHVPKDIFDRNEWRNITLNLSNYDTCSRMQFMFVYKNGDGKRFDENGDYRHFSVHSPLYIANMDVDGQFLLPLGGDTGIKMLVDSSIQSCDKKAVYTFKVSAGHNAKKYEIYLKKGGTTIPPIKVKEGLINNTFSFIDTSYSPNEAFEIIDTVKNLERNTVYFIYGRLINDDPGYTLTDTFQTNFANTIVDCPLRPMVNQGVLTSDSGFNFKNIDNNYKIIANFPNGHNVRTYQLFERKVPSTVWVKISDTIQTPSNSSFSYDFPTFVNKPNGEYYYRLELKNPSNDISPNKVYSNQVKIEQCLGCKALKRAIINPYPEGTSQPDPLTGNFSIKVSLERYHNVKKIELYERKINNAAEEFLYNPNNSTLIGNNIWTYNTTNNLEFSYIQTFVTHAPGIYYYAAKVYDVNNKFLLTYGLKVIYPERETGYCGAYLPEIWQTLSNPTATGISTLTNRLEFYLNPSCPGNKYKIYAYRLKDYQNLSSADPNLPGFQVDLLPRETTPIELFGTGQYISITQQELNSTSGLPTGQQSNGYFNREISPKLTSLDRWYSFDFICVGCLNGNNKRTIYKYLAKPKTTGQN